jgi:hypothetical protein
MGLQVPLSAISSLPSAIQVPGRWSVVLWSVVRGLKFCLLCLVPFPFLLSAFCFALCSSVFIGGCPPSRLPAFAVNLLFLLSTFCFLLLGYAHTPTGHFPHVPLVSHHVPPKGRFRRSTGHSINLSVKKGVFCLWAAREEMEEPTRPVPMASGGNPLSTLPRHRARPRSLALPRQDRGYARSADVGAPKPRGRPEENRTVNIL